MREVLQLMINSYGPRRSEENGIRMDSSTIYKAGAFKDFELITNIDSCGGGGSDESEMDYFYLNRNAHASELVNWTFPKEIFGKFENYSMNHPPPYFIRYVFLGGEGSKESAFFVDEVHRLIPILLRFQGRVEEAKMFSWESADGTFYKTINVDQVKRILDKYDIHPKDIEFVPDYHQVSTLNYPELDPPFITRAPDANIVLAPLQAVFEVFRRLVCWKHDTYRENCKCRKEFEKCVVLLMEGYGNMDETTFISQADIESEIHTVLSLLCPTCKQLAPKTPIKPLEDMKATDEVAHEVMKNLIVDTFNKIPFFPGLLSEEKLLVWKVRTTLYGVFLFHSFIKGKTELVQKLETAIRHLSPREWRTEKDVDWFLNREQEPSSKALKSQSRAEMLNRRRDARKGRNNGSKSETSCSSVSKNNKNLVEKLLFLDEASKDESGQASTRDARKGRVDVPNDSKPGPSCSSLPTNHWEVKSEQLLESIKNLESQWKNINDKDGEKPIFTTEGSQIPKESLLEEASPPLTEDELNKVEMFFKEALDEANKKIEKLPGPAPKQISEPVLENDKDKNGEEQIKISKQEEKSSEKSLQKEKFGDFGSKTESSMKIALKKETPPTENGSNQASKPEKRTELVCLNEPSTGTSRTDKENEKLPVFGPAPKPKKLIPKRKQPDPPYKGQRSLPKPIRTSKAWEIKTFRENQAPDPKISEESDAKTVGEHEVSPEELNLAKASKIDAACEIKASPVNQDPDPEVPEDSDTVEGCQSCASTEEELKLTKSELDSLETEKIEIEKLHQEEIAKIKKEYEEKLKAKTQEIEQSNRQKKEDDVLGQQKLHRAEKSNVDLGKSLEKANQKIWKLEEELESKPLTPEQNSTTTIETLVEKEKNALLVQRTVDLELQVERLKRELAMVKLVELEGVEASLKKATLIDISTLSSFSGPPDLQELKKKCEILEFEKILNAEEIRKLVAENSALKSKQASGSKE